MRSKSIDEYQQGLSVRRGGQVEGMVKNFVKTGMLGQIIQDDKNGRTG
ncbi:MAG: hypothetical protein WJ295_07325 [Ferrovum myxofaciens]